MCLIFLFLSWSALLSFFFFGGRCYFSVTTFNPFKVHVVNAGLQPAACGNPGHARLPKNKMLLLAACLGGEKRFLLPSRLPLFKSSLLLRLCLSDEGTCSSWQRHSLFCADIPASLRRRLHRSSWSLRLPLPPAHAQTPAPPSSSAAKCTVNKSDSARGESVRHQLNVETRCYYYLGGLAGQK